ncbi:hypothetical protein FQZ97_1118640 [compost metagenome]
MLGLCQQQLVALLQRPHAGQRKAQHGPLRLQLLPHGQHAFPAPFGGKDAHPLQRNRAFVAGLVDIAQLHAPLHLVHVQPGQVAVATADGDLGERQIAVQEDGNGTAIRLCQAGQQRRLACIQITIQQMQFALQEQQAHQ